MAWEAKSWQSHAQPLVWGNWQSLPQGFDVKALPSGLMAVEGVPVETVAVNEGDQSLLIRALEVQAQQRKAETIYLGDPQYRELPCVIGSAPPRHQWFCYAAFITPQRVPRPSHVTKLDAPAIGFRGFNWQGGALRSIGVQATWPVQREPQCAECKAMISFWPTGLTPQKAEEEIAAGTQHQAPQENCACGLYAHSKPDLIPGGSIKAVTIGYGRIIIHPDGWRAEKSEIIGLLAVKCKHEQWDFLRDLCSTCGMTKQALIDQCNEAAKAIIQKYTEPKAPMPESGVIRFMLSTSGVVGQTPSLDALEILAEQYGARVIQNWDDGIALAQEQGAQPISDEIYEEAAKNHFSGYPEGSGGYFIPSTWITEEAKPVMVLPEGWKVEAVPGGGMGVVSPKPKKKPRLQEKLQLKRRRTRNPRPALEAETQGSLKRLTLALIAFGA